MKVGDTVTWSSQAAGSKRTKIGKVVAIVPPDTRPYSILQQPDHEGIALAARYSDSIDSRSLPRKHESYIVAAVMQGHEQRKPVLYWPLVSLLRISSPVPDSLSDQLSILASMADKEGLPKAAEWIRLRARELHDLSIGHHVVDDPITLKVRWIKEYRSLTGQTLQNAVQAFNMASNQGQGIPTPQQVVEITQATPEAARTKIDRGSAGPLAPDPLTDRR